MDEGHGARLDEGTDPRVVEVHEPPGLGEARWILRGLSPDVQPVARYLLVRTDRRAETSADLDLPRVTSLDVLAAGVHAIREAISEAGERGLGAPRQRVLHGRLDRAFAVLVGRLLERAQRGSHILLRDLAHDLRSPLNSVVFLADALASEHSGVLSEVQRRQVSVLYTASMSLVGWLNDLIDGSDPEGLDAVRVLDEPFSVEAVLTQVDQLLGGLAAHSGIELAFRLETLGPRVGDRRILARILVNLVSNAISATPRGGRVIVRAQELRAEWLTLTVEDGGREADIERIRTHLNAAGSPLPRRRERGWTHGLGLSICALLVGAAGGRVDVQGGEGRPCRFTVELPFGREGVGSAANDGASV